MVNRRRSFSVFLLAFLPFIVLGIFACTIDAAQSDIASKGTLSKSDAPDGRIIRKTIGPKGGTIETPEGAFLSVPAGVFKKTTLVSIQYINASATLSKQQTVNLSLADIVFGGLKVKFTGTTNSLQTNVSLDALSDASSIQIGIPYVSSVPQDWLPIVANVRAEVEGSTKPMAFFLGLFSTDGGTLKANLSSLNPGTHCFLGTENAFLLSGQVKQRLLPAVVTTLDSWGMNALTAPNGSFIIPAINRTNGTELQQITVLGSHWHGRTGMFSYGLASGAVGPIPIPCPIDREIKLSNFLSRFRLNDIQRAVCEAVCGDEGFLNKFLDREAKAIHDKWVKYWRERRFTVLDVSPNPLHVDVSGTAKLTFDGSSYLNKKLPVKLDLGTSPIATLMKGVQAWFSISLDLFTLKSPLLIEFIIDEDPAENIIAQPTKVQFELESENPFKDIFVTGVKTGSTKGYIYIRQSSFTLTLKFNKSEKIATCCQDKTIDLPLSLDGSNDLKLEAATPVKIEVGEHCLIPGTPSNPSPIDGARGVDITEAVVLSWAETQNTSYYKITLTDPNHVTYTSLCGDLVDPWCVIHHDSPMYYVFGWPGTYHWMVEAINSCENSTSGPLWSFSIKPGKPSDPWPPDGATVVDISEGLTLSWAETSNTSSYRIKFTDPFLITRNFYPVDPCYVLAPGAWGYQALEIGGTCQWMVIAQNSFGFNTGPLWSFCVAPETPSGPSPWDGATQVGPNNIQLSWAPTPRTKSYDIYVWLDVYPEVPVANVTSEEYTIPELPPGTTFHWRIDARNSCSLTSGPTWYFTTGIVQD